VARPNRRLQNGRALPATTDKKQGFDGKDYSEQSSQVQAVVSFFAATDLCYWGNDEAAQNAVFQPMLGCRFKDKPEAYEKASPLCYCCKEAAPFLFFHGTADWIVPIEQSRKMCAKLKEAGANAKLIEIKDADHGWSGKDARLSTSETLKFFAEHLKK
jgi:dipeptidyl aminopeptidase/acylaminoacyl peptidase